VVWFLCFSGGGGDHDQGIFWDINTISCGRIALHKSSFIHYRSSKRKGKHL